MLKTIIALCSLCILLVSCGDNNHKEDFNKINSNYQKTIHYSGTDYDEVFKKIDDIKFEIRTFLNNYPKNENIYDVKKISDDIVSIEENLHQEKADFNNLTNSYKEKYSLSAADEEIKKVNIFLKKYPNSFKKNELNNNIDELKFVKFKIETDVNISTVSRLDEVLNKAKKYFKEIDNDDYKNKISKKITELSSKREDLIYRNFKNKMNTNITSIYDLNYAISIIKNYKNEISKNTYINEMISGISELESKRNNIFSDEYSRKLSRLVNKMEKESKSEAQGEHIICGEIKSSNMTYENDNNVGNRVKLIRRYEYLMSGGFFCSDTYKVKVESHGLIYGDPTEGVTSKVTDTTVISDIIW